jgi:hypothetical protein
VGVEHRYPNLPGETAGVRYNNKQEWPYWSGMDNDERLVLKCFNRWDVEGMILNNSANSILTP